MILANIKRIRLASFVYAGDTGTLVGRTVCRLHGKPHHLLVGGRPGMISGATGALAVVMVALVVTHGVEYLAVDLI